MLGLLLVLLFCACAPKLSNLASLVTFDIAYQGSAVKTYWRKLGDQHSKEFVLGGNNWFFLLWRDTFRKAKIISRMLEPGVYYLASFEVQVGNRLLKSQTTLPRWRTGWDYANKRPLFLAFRVYAHTPLKLPPVELAIRHTSRNKAKGVPESYKVNFMFNNEGGVWITGPYTKTFD